MLALLVAAQAVAPSACVPTTIIIGQDVNLVTVSTLSSKTTAKGDMVPLKVVGDVVVDGHVAVPAGTPAVAQIVDARQTGGMGSPGKLVIAPLYLQLAGRTVRLSGGRSAERGANAPLVLGLWLVSPLLSGRSATIPIGTRVQAMVAKTASLPCSP